MDIEKRIWDEAISRFFNKASVEAFAEENFGEKDFVLDVSRWICGSERKSVIHHYSRKRDSSIADFMTSDIFMEYSLKIKLEVIQKIEGRTPIRPTLYEENRTEFAEDAKLQIAKYFMKEILERRVEILNMFNGKKVDYVAGYIGMKEIHDVLTQIAYSIEQVSEKLSKDDD